MLTLSQNADGGGTLTVYSVGEVAKVLEVRHCVTVYYALNYTTMDVTSTALKYT